LVVFSPHGNLSNVTWDREAHDRAAANLLMALDMYETGVAMKLAQLRRADPAATDDELSHRLDLWLQSRPGAEHGDAEGIPRAFPPSLP
jgi:Rv0078B-related antitoxin